MKRTLLACSIFTFAVGSAFAGDPPPFFKDTYPASALKPAWEEYQAVYSDKGAVSAKMKQLIALGVSAQVPCQYCILAHTQKAKKLGATEEEIKEALAVASMVRKWSTVINGMNYDMNKFKAEIGMPTN
ncbi:MAG: carboxymuconolactone decarboxylase family protein [Hyphomicrobiaceae bacterium]